MKNCSSLQELLEGVTNLISLRHLEENTRLILNIAGIRRLTCLQNLEEFAVHKARGYKITELKDMMEVRGSLCNKGLENVATEEEANEAKLNTNEYLSSLELIWEDKRDISHEICRDEGVLKGLKPHHELKELKIKGYAHAKFPSWMASQLSSLQTLHLSNCIRCICLPSLRQLPYLKNLEIRRGDEVKQIGQEFSGNGAITGFPLLKELVLDDMPNLEEWLFADDVNFFVSKKTS